MGYWLVKTEPNSYSWEDLVAAGSDIWDGVRNYQAAAHIGAMSPGDKALVYHSGRQRAIVGLAEVVSTPYPDPTADDPRWSAVDLQAIAAIKPPLSLAEMKQDPIFADWALVRQSRLSVMPVSVKMWEQIMKLTVVSGSETPPAGRSSRPSQRYS